MNQLCRSGKVYADLRKPKFAPSRVLHIKPSLSGKELLGLWCHSAVVLRVKSDASPCSLRTNCVCQTDGVLVLSLALGTGSHYAGEGISPSFHFLHQTSPINKAAQTPKCDNMFVSFCYSVIVLLLLTKGCRNQCQCCLQRLFKHLILSLLMDLL